MKPTFPNIGPRQAEAIKHLLTDKILGAWFDRFFRAQLQVLLHTGLNRLVRRSELMRGRKQNQAAKRRGRKAVAAMRKSVS